MNTLHPPLAESPAAAPRRSRMAVLSLVTSVLPLASPVGFVAGVIALVRMRRNPALEGRLLAWVGIGLSVVVTAAVYGWGYMVVQAVHTMGARPEIALRAAMAGNTETFRRNATGAASRVSAAELNAWAQGLTARFGELERVSTALETPTQRPPDAGRDQYVFEGAYMLQFERAAVPARVLFEMTPDIGQRLDAYRIRRFTIEPTGEAAIFFPDAPPDAVAPTP